MPIKRRRAPRLSAGGAIGGWSVAAEEVWLLWASAAALTSLQLLALGRQHSTLPLLEAAFPTTLLSAGECSGE